MGIPRSHEQDMIPLKHWSDAPSCGNFEDRHRELKRFSNGAGTLWKIGLNAGHVWKKKKLFNL